MYKVTINNDDGLGNIVINEIDTKSQNRVTGQIQKQVNSIDSFTFVIYPNNIGYSKIIPMRTHVDVADTLHNDNDTFHGRVLQISPSMDESGVVCKTVTCEGELGYLCDSVMLYGYMKNVQIYTFLQQLVIRHNSRVATDKQFTLGTVDADTKAYDFTFNYETALETLNSLLINNENIGGEIRVRYANGKRYLDYAQTTFSAGSDTKIELAVNMRSSTQNVDPSSLVTRLIPLGAKISDESDERLTISNIYIDNSELVSSYGIIQGTKVFEDITTKGALQTAGQKWLNSQKAMLKQYQISAVDLSLIDSNYTQFRVGTTYRVINSLIGLDEDLRCIGMTIDISDATATSLTFGDKFETLTSLTAKKTAQLQQQIDDVQGGQTDLIKSIVDKQSALITGVTDSYYYIDTTEGKERMCFMDSPDKDTAVNVLQINKNGIGFSHTGINGQYTSAWTIDGTFNTDYIIAKVLTGLKINNGNGTFSVDESGNVIAKALQVLGGKVNITADNQADSRIQLHYGDWTIKMSPLEITLTNSTIAGNIKLQAGGAFFCNGEQVMCSILAESGDITTEGSITAGESITAEGSAVFKTNLNVIGDIFCNSIATKNHLLD